MMQVSPAPGADVTRFIGITVRPYEAVVDTAAEDGVIGVSQLPPYLQCLSEAGHEPVWDKDENVSCSGIGGGAKHLGSFTAPYNMVGVQGTWKVHVLEDTPAQPIPLLLPITICAKHKMNIDFDKGICQFRALPGRPYTRMRKVENHPHCAISICDFGSSATLAREETPIYWETLTDESMPEDENRWESLHTLAEERYIEVTPEQVAPARSAGPARHSPGSLPDLVNTDDDTDHTIGDADNRFASLRTDSPPSMNHSEGVTAALRGPPDPPAFRDIMQAFGRGSPQGRQDYYIGSDQSQSNQLTDVSLSLTL